VNKPGPSQQKSQKQMPTMASANTGTSNVPTYISLLVAVIALVGTIYNGRLQSQAAQEAAELNYQAAQRSSDIKMSEIAVAILRVPITDDVASIRGWAMDVIDNGNTRKFSAAERMALLKKPLPGPASPASSWLSALPNPCAKFRRIPDGSWKQTDSIDLGGPHGLHLEGNTVMGSAETKYLDQNCQ
jgi:hypothetical protein